MYENCSSLVRADGYEIGHLGTHVIAHENVDCVQFTLKFRSHAESVDKVE